MGEERSPAFLGLGAGSGLGPLMAFISEGTRSRLAPLVALARHNTYEKYYSPLPLPHRANPRDILAKNMRRLRAARGLTQEALAYDCGINRTYLSAVERAERNISIDNVARIAKGLHVEPWKLLRDD
jgi:DNA-binding XRE family transcriptional regulator